jgi:hypothetical protein
MVYLQQGYGFGNADISDIPKGPAPDKPESTAGWNDPKEKQTFATVDSSMRINKKKKSAPTQSYNPADVPMFTPVAQPQG